MINMVKPLEPDKTKGGKAPGFTGGTNGTQFPKNNIQAERSSIADPYIDVNIFM